MWEYDNEALFSLGGCALGFGCFWFPASGGNQTDILSWKGKLIISSLRESTFARLANAVTKVVK